MKRSLKAMPVMSNLGCITNLFTPHQCRKLYYGLVLLVLASLLIGCSKRYSYLPAYSPFHIGDYENDSVGRFKTTYLVEQIDKFYRGTDPGPLAVTTFVNLDDLDSTSSFGRVYAEQVLSELSMKGYDVIELRKANALHFVDKGGEFMLSRASDMLNRAHHLGGVVVGTYSSSPDRVYVNARLVDPSTSMVVAAASIELPKTKEIAKMLRSGGMPAALERIPMVTSKMVQVPITGYPNGMYSGRVPYGEAGMSGVKRGVPPKVQPRLPGLEINTKSSSRSKVNPKLSN